MATTLTRYVNTNSTSGGDGTTNATTGANRAFVSRAACVAQIVADGPDLVTRDVMYDVLISGTATDTAAVDFSVAFTTDATRYIHFRDPIGPLTLMGWDTARPQHVVNNTIVWKRVPSFTRFSYLQMRLAGSGTNDNNCNIISNGSDTNCQEIRVSGCVLRGEIRTSPARTFGNTCTVFSFLSDSTAYTVRCYNTLVMDWDWGVDKTARIYSAPNAAALFYRCTFIGPASDANSYLSNDNPYSRVKWRNCLFQGFTKWDNANGSAAAGGTNYNATTGAIAPGANSRTLQTFSFMGTNDFRLSSGDTGAKGYGADLSADPTEVVTTDFFGNAIAAPYDIGAAEYAASVTLTFGSLQGFDKMFIVAKDEAASAKRFVGPFFLVDNTDGITPEDIATAGVKVALYKNGVSAGNSSADITKIAGTLGAYGVQLTAAEVDTEGNLVGILQPTGCRIASFVVQVGPADSTSVGESSANIADAVVPAELAALDAFLAGATTMVINGQNYNITRDATSKYITSITLVP